MREFLSQRSVDYEERNVAHRPDWRSELVTVAGDLVVPTTATAAGHLAGFDEAGLLRLLDLPDQPAAEPWRGLDPAEPPPAPSGQPPDGVGAAVAHLQGRIQREMEYNAARGGGPYRQGRHDALRFARDALARILAGTYEPAGILADRALGDGG